MNEYGVIDMVSACRKPENKSRKQTLTERNVKRIRIKGKATGVRNLILKAKLSQECEVQVTIGKKRSTKDWQCFHCHSWTTRTFGSRREWRVTVALAAIPNLHTLWKL